MPKGRSTGASTATSATREQDTVQRHVLPIPDVTPVGLTTFDAKDLDTKYPPIRPVRPPAGAPNVLIVLVDDAGFGASSAFGVSDAQPREARQGRPEVRPVPHHSSLRPHAGRAAEWPEPPLRGHE